MPPVASAVALPLQKVLQLASVLAVIEAIKVAGSLIMMLSEVTQPLASVMLTVYVPAAKPVAVVVVCVLLSFHK